MIYIFLRHRLSDVSKCATGPAGFTVCVIPHTRRITTFSFRKSGDTVNLETDMLTSRRGSKSAAR